MTDSEEMIKIMNNEKHNIPVRTCPYCQSNRVESMGFKDNTNKVRRYRCKVCNRSHSRDAVNYELREGNTEKIFMDTDKEKYVRKTVTINVIKRTKERIDNIKLYERESYDDIINRLLDEHYILNNTTPKQKY